MVSLGDNAMAIGFFPFIFVRDDTRDHAELLRHEEIHMRQQLELLVVFAWILYGIEYFYARWVKKFDKRQAYYYTALEQEAHRNAMKEGYLKTRKPYAVLKYIKDKKLLGRTSVNKLIEKNYL